jgi:DNA-binding NarL/FixJ family response regulator
MIKIGIAEDQEIYRNGLVGLLNNIENFNVIIEAESGQGIIDQIKTNEPDVVLLDFRMEGLNGVDTASRISKLYPEIKILMLSMYDAQEFVIRSIENGANGYLTKDDDPNEIITAIDCVYSTGYYLNERTSKILISQMVKSGTVQPVFENEEVEFSKIELDVIRLICEEKSAVEISDILFKSKRTIDGHRASIMKKIGARNVTGIVMYAVKNNLVEF